jgi:hypothetical protein
MRNIRNLKTSCWSPKRNIKYISCTWACTILIIVTSLLFDFIRLATCDLVLALTLRGGDLGYLEPYDQFSLLVSKSLDTWFNKDWHLDICDSSWLDWFLRSNIHLPFFITSSTSTPRLPLALPRCMVHYGQVLVNLSSIIIMSHISLHVLHRIIIETLLHIIKLLS